MCYREPVRSLAALLILGLPAHSLAYEDQLAVGLDLGYAQVVGDVAGAGVAAGPQGKIGLNDTWNAFAASHYGFHPSFDAGDEPLHAVSLAAGFEYVFDVLQWIPYGGIGAELLWAAQGDKAGVVGGAQVSVGLDYLASRDHSYGITARWHLLVSDLEAYPAYVTVALRGSLLWDL